MIRDNGDMLVPSNWKNSDATIKVIGIGGGGNNAVNNMFRTGIAGVHFVACNTDEQALQSSPLGTKIQLGSQGLGAGCNPELGKQAAKESLDKIQEVLGNNTRMVFLTAGMGGGTGTGATPVIARAAKEKGVLTVAIVTMPFSDEGAEYTRRAREGVLALQSHVDSLLLINNDRLYEVHGELTLKNAFAKADEVLTTAVKGIAEIITRHGYINVDFADVFRAMENSRVAVMGSGIASGEQRAMQAAREALSSPLLDNNDISGARSVLVNIAASEDSFMMGELKQAMDYIQKSTGGTAEFVKRGVTYDDALGDAMHITIVATGFRMQPFDDLKERVIIVDDGDECAGNATSRGVGERTPPADDDDCLIEQDNSRRVFEIGHSAPAPAVAITAKPELAQTDGSKMKELTDTPAYIRRNVPINTPECHCHAPQSTLTKDAAGKHHLSQENSYMDKKVD
ncbi:MAG: cell division protein FtsZ [Prevotellaceae bacterium]|nr:cell division protein FtsZ [Prevotellaceae bacterium]